MEINSYLIDIALTRVLKSENECCSEGPGLSWLFGEDCITDLLKGMIISSCINMIIQKIHYWLFCSQKQYYYNSLPIKTILGGCMYRKKNQMRNQNFVRWKNLDHSFKGGPLVFKVFSLLVTFSSMIFNFLSPNEWSKFLVTLLTKLWFFTGSISEIRIHWTGLWNWKQKILQNWYTALKQLFSIKLYHIF